jgi:hypothetical protein
MKKIICKFPFTDQLISLEPHEHLSIEEAIDLTIADGCIEYAVVDSSEIDSKFIQFCELQNGKIIPNIEQIKEFHLNKFRQARTPLLEKLDLEYMRADEAGDLELKKEIASKKQALRDVTLTPLPDDLEGIKNTWPEILGQNPFKK